MAKEKNPFAKVDGLAKHTPYATLSDNQALTKVYGKLSGDAAKVLGYCKLCRKYHTGISKNAELKAINGNILYFYFNRAIQKQYHLNNPNKVVNNILELINYGFIDVIECNGNTRKKNIYAFSDKWADIEKGTPIKLSQGAITFIRSNTKATYLKKFNLAVLENHTSTCIKKIIQDIQ